MQVNIYYSFGGRNDNNVSNYYSMFVISQLDFFEELTVILILSLCSVMSELINYQLQITIITQPIILIFYHKFNIHIIYNLSEKMLSKKRPFSVKLIFVFEDGKYSSQQIQCTDEASFSCLLTMAEYLCQKWPDMAPPQFPENDKIYQKQWSVQEKRQKKLYFEPWCDYFNSLIDSKGNGHIQMLDGILYLICHPKKQFELNEKDQMKKVFKKIQNEQFEVLLKKLTEIKEGTQRTKVGIINFATSQLRNDYFNPKVNLLSLFAGIWFDHGDTWRRYDILKGNYPNEQQIMNTDVFILSGSTLSVNDNNQHVQKAMQILKSGLQKNKKLKLLGLCFGHQSIAKYFGGAVERKQQYSGIEIIKFNKQTIPQFKYLQGLPQLNEDGYLMFEFHNDYVVKIPQNFRILGNSPSCEIESMISVDGRCLTFQFHSQYTFGYTSDFEKRIKKYFKQDLYKTDYTLNSDILKKYGMGRHIQSCQIIRNIARQFISYNVVQAKPSM